MKYFWYEIAPRLIMALYLVFGYMVYSNSGHLEIEEKIGRIGVALITALIFSPVAAALIISRKKIRAAGVTIIIWAAAVGAATSISSLIVGASVFVPALIAGILLLNGKTKPTTRRGKAKTA